MQISLLTDGVNFFTTCKSAGDATLKLELDVLGRMLHLHCHFRNEDKDLHPEILKPKSTLDSRIKCSYWVTQTFGLR